MLKGERANGKAFRKIKNKKSPSDTDIRKRKCDEAVVFLKYGKKRGPLKREMRNEGRE